MYLFILADLSWAAGAYSLFTYSISLWLNLIMRKASHSDDYFTNIVQNEVNKNPIFLKNNYDLSVCVIIILRFDTEEDRKLQSYIEIDKNLLNEKNSIVR